MQEIKTSSSGDNLLEFHEKPWHRYYLNSKPVKSVTSIIKLGFPTPERLMNWKIKNAKTWKKKGEEAAEIGTYAHKFAELTVKGTPELFEWDIVNAHKDKDKIYNCIDLFTAWYASRDSKIIATEVLVASPSSDYAGTMDVLSETDEGYGIEDYKTSSGFFVEQFLQTGGGYSIAAEEWLRKPIAWVRINLFGKTSATFDTLKVNHAGWYFNGKMIRADKEALTNLRLQWCGCLETVRFNDTYTEMFDDLYEVRKVNK